MRALRRSWIYIYETRAAMVDDMIKEAKVLVPRQIVVDEQSERELTKGLTQPFMRKRKLI